MGNNARGANGVMDPLAEADFADEEPRLGRRLRGQIKKKTFLMRRCDAEYFPIKAECEALTQMGYGYASGTTVYETWWPYQRFEAFIAALYPTAPLPLVGFDFAKLDRHKKLVPINLQDDFTAVLSSCSILVVVPRRNLWPGEMV